MQSSSNKSLYQVLKSVIKQKDPAVQLVLNARKSPRSVPFFEDSFDHDYQDLINHLYKKHKEKLNPLLSPAVTLPEIIKIIKPIVISIIDGFQKNSLLHPQDQENAFLLSPTLSINESERDNQLAIPDTPKKTKKLNQQTTVTKDYLTDYLHSVVSKHYTAGKQMDILLVDADRTENPNAPWPSDGIIDDICKNDIEEIKRRMVLINPRLQEKLRNCHSDQEAFPLFRCDLGAVLTQYIQSAKSITKMFKFDWSIIEAKCRMYNRLDILKLIGKTKAQVHIVKSYYESAMCAKQIESVKRKSIQRSVNSLLEKEAGSALIPKESRDRITQIMSLCHRRTAHDLKIPATESHPLHESQLMLQVALDLKKDRPKSSSILEDTRFLIHLMLTTCVKLEEMIVHDELQIGAGYFFKFSPESQMKAWREIALSCTIPESPGLDDMVSVSPHVLPVIRQLAHSNAEIIGAKLMRPSEKIIQQHRFDKIWIKMKYALLVRAKSLKKDQETVKQRHLTADDAERQKKEIKALGKCISTLNYRKTVDSTNFSAKAVGLLINKMASIDLTKEVTDQLMPQKSEKIITLMKRKVLSTYGNHEKVMKFIQKYREKILAEIKEQKADSQNISKLRHIDFIISALMEIQAKGTHAPKEGRLPIKNRWYSMAHQVLDRAKIIDIINAIITMRRTPKNSDLEEIQQKIKRLAGEIAYLKERSKFEISRLSEMHLSELQMDRENKFNDEKKLRSPYLKAGQTGFSQKSLSVISWKVGYTKTLKAVQKLILDNGISTYSTNIVVYGNLGQAIVHQLFTDLGAYNAHMYLAYDKAIMKIFLLIARKTITLKFDKNQNTRLKILAKEFIKNTNNDSLVDFLSALGSEMLNESFKSHKNDILEFLTAWINIIDNMRKKRARARHFKEICFESYDLSKLSALLQWASSQKDALHFMPPLGNFCTPFQQTSRVAQRTIPLSPPSFPIRRRAISDPNSQGEALLNASIIEDKHNRISAKQGIDPANCSGFNSRKTMRHRIICDGAHDQGGFPRNATLMNTAIKSLPSFDQLENAMSKYPEPLEYSDPNTPKDNRSSPSLLTTSIPTAPVRSIALPTAVRQAATPGTVHSTLQESTTFFSLEASSFFNCSTDQPSMPQRHS